MNRGEERRGGSGGEIGEERKNDKQNKQRRDGSKVGIAVESEAIRPVENAGGFFDRSEWLTTKETAIFLRKFSPSGTPSSDAVHKLVSRGCLRRRKFAGRLYFRKREIDFLIDSSIK